LSMVRDALRRPGSLAARLSAVNRENAKICEKLRIHCNVCGIDGGMLYDYPDVQLRREHGIGLLRETLSCRACGASMRQRQMAFGLLELAACREGTRPADLRAWRARVAPGGAEIVDTDSFSAISYVLRGMAGYLHTQYKPELPNGDRLADGSINADLLAMPFADDSLDVIMTSDVMEHVRDDAGAHREIYRCLRTGGVYLFTVPYDPTLA